ncbi:FAD/NAD(P)-binding domain-containing protein [Aspergillus affinis]|uniref:FAD/NAD(P)-binding domain-containing protein n=1 Tax=Aspergillus affinis TaxID=1070780 RepID=UPI0022FF1A4A|nr:FAD/NAD(P)-binding domain-containing protein [Aspergillus affinis]KAI9038664.1 FAD/NAD(P)-binding domain-containing protein [Aspergillus affinis]
MLQDPDREVKTEEELTGEPAAWRHVYMVIRCPGLCELGPSRLTDLAYTASILPMTLVGFYASYLLAYLAPTLTMRHVGIWLWHMFPIWISLGQCILARTVTPNTLASDRLHRPTRDLRTIRITTAR